VLRAASWIAVRMFAWQCLQIHLPPTPIAILLLVLMTVCIIGPTFHFPLSWSRTAFLEWCAVERNANHIWKYYLFINGFISVIVNCASVRPVKVHGHVTFLWWT
jgi:hypothetical protein